MVLWEDIVNDAADLAEDKINDGEIGAPFQLAKEPVNTLFPSEPTICLEILVSSNDDVRFEYTDGKTLEDAITAGTRAWILDEVVFELNDRGIS